MLLGLVSTLLFAVQPMIGQWVIDHVFIIKDVSLLTAIGVGGGILACGYGLSVGTKYLYLRMSLRVMADMRLEMYGKILNFPSRVTSQKRVGDMVARLHEDLAETQRLYTESLLQAVTLFIELTLSVFLLWYLDGKLLLFCLLLLPLLVWSAQKFRVRLFEENMKLRRQTSDNYSFVLDGLTSIRFIRAAGLEVWMGKRYQKELEEIAGQQLRLAFLNGAAQGVSQLVLLTAAVTTLWVIGKEVVAGSVTLGMLFAYTAYQARFFSGAQAISQLYLRFQKGRVSTVRIAEYFSQTQEADGTVEAPSLQTALTLRKVHYRAAAGQEVLKSLDFTLRRGEKVGLIGQNGSGKSTFADLLLRIHKPDQGSILYDGLDIGQFTRSSWSNRVCLVAHDNPLWYGSVADVLRIGNTYVTEEQMIEVLEEVGVWQELGQRREALQTQVGEKGLALSAGQKQRLQLARAFLQDSDILILDEATCHLDSQAEQQMFELIRRKWKSKSVIVITHRPENLYWADRLYTLSDGKLLEQDSGGKVKRYG